MAINEVSVEPLDDRSTNHQLASHNHSTNHHNNYSSQINLNPGPIDFDECLRDSPKFRHDLKENLVYIEHLETCMSRAIKQVSNYIETGRDHIRSQKDFIQSMRVVNQALGTSNTNLETSKKVNTLLETLEEVMQLHEIVIDQSARTIGSSLSKFINDDLVKLKDARKSFDKISHEYDQALLKYSQPVRKQQEDSENLLIATSTAFTHTSLDLSIQLTTLQSKKGYDILGSLLSFIRAHSTFFHQGFDSFEDLKPHISDMDEYLSNIQDEFETLTRNLPSKHLMVSNNELRPLCFDNRAEQIHLEGYLFKRASNGFKVWNRRWFILKNHQLIYQKRGDIQPIIMEDDLRLLTVRPIEKADGDRRFCFEVVSPHKSHILQADSESACKTWISAIQAGINAAFHDTEHKSQPPPPPTSRMSTTNSETPATTATTGAASSYWSSSFSLKALQQQATSRLNSITSLGDTKDVSKSRDKMNQQSRQLKVGVHSQDDDDETQDYKIDDQGRSYAPLRFDDDEPQQMNNGGESGDLDSKTSYPAAANESTKDNSSSRSATNSRPDPPEKPQRAYMIILAMPGNDACADCGALQPRWASINLGITLCIECAGIHRSLGVHLSKVRSLTLDTEVWSPEIVQLMLSLGNTSVNSAYLACYRGQTQPIDADSSREDRESWIKSKYLLKEFMRPPGSSLHDDSTDSSDLNESSTTEKPASPANVVVVATAAAAADQDHEDTIQSRAPTGDDPAREVIHEIIASKSIDAKSEQTPD